MNNLYELNLSQEEKIDIAKQVGADVPVLLTNGLKLMENIGEKITKIDSKMSYYFVIIKPDITLNTGEMYRKLDNNFFSQDFIKYNNEVNEVIKSIKNQDLLTITKNLYNSFDNVIEKESVITKIKEDFIKFGAMASFMTGSGSAVCGIYKEKKEAKESYYKLKEKYKNMFYAKTI
ncbi:MAG: hypothetical protein LBL91_04510 [Lachnospiraceae bacterium]|nr:hypothetical protein [Lachnospiraceae bacterium]